MTAVLGGEIVFFLVSCPRCKIRIMFIYSPTTKRSSNMQTTTTIYNYKPTKPYSDTGITKTNAQQAEQKNNREKNKRSCQLLTSGCFESLGKLLLYFALQLKI